jgi:hypothetical protein
MSMTFRTNDYTRWGSGQGSNLSAAEVDVNFWTLYSALTALQDHALTTENQIDYFSVAGNQLFVTMMDHMVFGPYTLPTASWNFRGPWSSTTSYHAMDVVTDSGSVYLVLATFTSASTFDPGATIGIGQQCYGLLLSSPQDELPTGGVDGQVLMVVDPGSPTGYPQTAWVTQTRLLALFIEGTPLTDELLLRFECVEAMTWPAGLTGSRASSATPPTTDQTYALYKNGTAIGSLTFTPSPEAVDIDFPTAITFTPGDIITMFAPGSPGPDPHMTDTSFTFVATLP